MTRETILIDVAKQYSPYPSGRIDADGPFNGSRFREEFLIPAIQKAENKFSLVVVDMSNVKSFGSSFLEEAFGALIRDGKYNLEKFKSLVDFKIAGDGREMFLDVIEDILTESEQIRKRSRR